GSAPCRAAARGASPPAGGGAGRRTGASRPFLPASGSRSHRRQVRPHRRLVRLPPPPGTAPSPACGGGLGWGQVVRRWLRQVPFPAPRKQGRQAVGWGRGRPAVGPGSRCDAGGGRAHGSILAGLPTHGSTRMTDTLRIAMAQFDFPVGDVAGNASRIAAMIGEARDEFGADIVLFPELAVSGYPPEDLLMRPSFLADCDRAMREVVARAARGIVAVVGWPESAGSVLYNSASVLRDGRIEAT